MKLNKKLIPSSIYVIFTFLMLLMWIPIPEVCHFLGASSAIHAFLFAVGSNHRLLAYLALSWIPIFIANLIVWFIFAVKKEKYLPFNVVVACDLFVSLLIIGSKIQAGNYSDLGLTLVGYTIRLGYFIWMLHFTKKE